MLRARKNLSLLSMRWVILWQMNMPTFIEDYMGYQKLLNSTIMRAKGLLLSYSDVLQKKWFIATIPPMRSICLHKRWSKASFYKREMWCCSECEIIMPMSCLGWIWQKWSDLKCNLSQRTRTIKLIGMILIKNILKKSR